MKNKFPNTIRIISLVTLATFVLIQSAPAYALRQPVSEGSALGEVTAALTGNVSSSGRATGVITPTGLLLRGIMHITKKDYEKIRAEGFLPKNQGGVSKDTTNNFPGKVSFSLCSDELFHSATLLFYGPLVDKMHVAFIIGPEYVRAHKDRFSLVGEYFNKTSHSHERNIYKRGLELLGLSDVKPEPYDKAFGDEIQADGVSAEAIAGIIADHSMVDKLRQWDVELGLSGLPIYAFDKLSSEKSELREEWLPVPGAASAGDEAKAKVELFTEVDNHVEFYHWLVKSIESGALEKGLPLFLFDAHDDTRFRPDDSIATPRDSNWLRIACRNGYLGGIYWVVPPWIDEKGMEYLAQQVERLKEGGIQIKILRLEEVAAALANIDKEALATIDADFFDSIYSVGTVYPVHISDEKEIQDVAHKIIEPLSKHKNEITSINVVLTGFPFLQPTKAKLIAATVRKEFDDLMTSEVVLPVEQGAAIAPAGDADNATAEGILVITDNIAAAKEEIAQAMGIGLAGAINYYLVQENSLSEIRKAKAAASSAGIVLMFMTNFDIKLAVLANLSGMSIIDISDKAQMEAFAKALGESL